MTENKNVKNQGTKRGLTIIHKHAWEAKNMSFKKLGKIEND